MSYLESHGLYYKINNKTDDCSYRQMIRIRKEQNCVVLLYSAKEMSTVPTVKLSLLCKS